ncbi:tyrosine-type recombinase/integrase [Granulosicoccus sp.]|nr:tyrosine-type recombinase/integrase [Granulosicoccus sp.]MDB4224546.1 tyrosine-type recombinase/integrase [Granulosicoccus sp.]
MNKQLRTTIAVEAYLSYRRNAGYKLQIEGEQLLRFARFADDKNHRGALTIELARLWATSNTTNRLTAARRIEALRGFAKYCLQFDSDTIVPPADLFGKAHRRLTPHIYSESEIRDLLDACDELHPIGGLRSHSCRAVFGLLASTGMRIGEACVLRDKDVDLNKALVEVKNSKFGKSRWVPLHRSTVNHLREYVEKRDNMRLYKKDNRFFAGDYGRCLSAIAVRYAFGLIRKRLGWRSRGDYQYPRVHDLRHTFICRTIQMWYEEGVDIDKKILCLSTYVGHTKVTDTFWYLTATPELLALAAARTSKDGEVIDA